MPLINVRLIEGVFSDAQKREVIANEQWSTVQEEDKQNQELLDLSRQILELTRAVHAYAAAGAAGRSPEPP